MTVNNMHGEPAWSRRRFMQAGLATAAVAGVVQQGVEPGLGQESPVPADRETMADVPFQKREPRMGLIVPKFQTSAVARNRLRRRLREIWRQEIQQRQPAWDLVIRARREAYAADFDALRTQLRVWREAVLGAG